MSNQAEQSLSARIIYKHKLEADWQNATEFKPKAGEFVIYDPEIDADGNILKMPEGRTVPYTTTRIKVGDGNNTLEKLPFVPFSERKIDLVPSLSSELVYNGTMQAPSWNDFNPSELILAGDTCGQEAGTYIASFYPQVGYCWEDGSKGIREVKWTIEKATPTLTVSQSYFKLSSNGDDGTFTIITNSDGRISLGANNSNFVTSKQLLDNVVTFTTTGQGLAKIRITVLESSNYKEAVTYVELSTSDLTTMSWSEIENISKQGNARNYFEIGDLKTIQLDFGNTSLIEGNGVVNRTVFIIGFDHNNSIEGTGIHFCGFKSDAAVSNICLADSVYGTEQSILCLNMNDSASCDGGWFDCRMRYSVLGSTNINKSNATEDCAVSPVSNTIIATFPSDLRAVMKPMTKYTADRKSGAYTNRKTIDFLPLLSEYEVFGNYSYSNSVSEGFEQQYEYFMNGNSTKFRYGNSTSDFGIWWLRSSYGSADDGFCLVNEEGKATATPANYSLGVVPIFKV